MITTKTRSKTKMLTSVVLISIGLFAIASSFSFFNHPKKESSESNNRIIIKFKNETALDILSLPRLDFNPEDRTKFFHDNFLNDILNPGSTGRILPLSQNRYNEASQLLKENPNITIRDIDSKYRDILGKKIGRFFDDEAKQPITELSNIFIFSLRNSSEEIDKIVEKLSSNKNIMYVVKDNYIMADGEQMTDEEMAEFYSPKKWSEKVFFEKDQWYFENEGKIVNSSYQLKEDADVDILDAWSIEKGSKNTVIAFIDSGIELENFEFDDNLLRDANENIIGYDFVNDDKIPDDEGGHGTMVTGIAAAEENDFFMRGVCLKCSIMPIKYLNKDNKGFTSDQLLSIMFAIENGADVINLSSGSYEINHAQNDLVKSAIENYGIVFVASAGNDYQNKKRFPAAIPIVIAVAGTDNQDKIFYSPYKDPISGSNYGTWVDISAPGLNVMTTSLVPGGAFAFDGTSASVPFISGSAGLLISYAKKQNVSLSVGQVTNYLLKNTDNIDDINTEFIGLLGKGRLNTGKSLLALKKDTEDKKLVFNGDVNTDGIFDYKDMSCLEIMINKKQSTINLNLPRNCSNRENLYELNCDGVINELDYMILEKKISLTPLPLDIVSTTSILPLEVDSNNNNIPDKCE